MTLLYILAEEKIGRRIDEENNYRGVRVLCPMFVIWEEELRKEK